MMLASSQLSIFFSPPHPILPPIFYLSLCILLIIPSTTTANPSDIPLNLTTFLTLLPSNTSLSSLHLFGTHNSLSYNRPFTHHHRSLPGSASFCHHRITAFSVCQHHPLPSQLRIGIRFLDLRLQHTHDRFLLYHGPESLDVEFSAVVDMVAEFLAAFPGETVVARVAENRGDWARSNREYQRRPAGKGKRQRQRLRWPWESGSERKQKPKNDESRKESSDNCEKQQHHHHHHHGERNTRSFSATFAWYTKRHPQLGHILWRNGGATGIRGIPSLGEIRGKLVILQDWPGPWEVGLPFWADNYVRLHDAWKVGSLPRKLHRVREFWENAAKEAAELQEKRERLGWTETLVSWMGADGRWRTAVRRPGDRLFVSFLSGSFGGGAVPPRWLAEKAWDTVWGWWGGREGTGGRHVGGTSPVRPVGIVVGDFVTEALMRAVVRRNFESGGAGEGLRINTEWEQWSRGSWKQESSLSGLPET